MLGTEGGVRFPGIVQFHVGDTKLACEGPESNSADLEQQFDLKSQFSEGISQLLYHREILLVSLTKALFPPGRTQSLCTQ